MAFVRFAPYLPINFAGISVPVESFDILPGIRVTDDDPSHSRTGGSLVTGTPADALGAVTKPASVSEPAEKHLHNVDFADIDRALDEIDRAGKEIEHEVTLRSVPTLETITTEAIELQIRFLFPYLENDLYSPIVQDLANKTLSKLRTLSNEDFRTEYQHELATYGRVIRGAVPTHFLIRLIKEHHQIIEATLAAESIRLAEEDRAGRRRDLMEAFFSFTRSKSGSRP